MGTLQQLSRRKGLNRFGVGCSGDGEWLVIPERIFEPSEDNEDSTSENARKTNNIGQSVSPSEVQSCLDPEE